MLTGAFAGRVEIGVVTDGVGHFEFAAGFARVIEGFVYIDDMGYPKDIANRWKCLTLYAPTKVIWPVFSFAVKK